MGGGVGEGAGTLLLSGHVAHKSELTEAGEPHGPHREDSSSEMPTAPASIEGRHAGLRNQKERALVFTVRKCHMPRSSPHINPAATRPSPRFPDSEMAEPEKAPHPAFAGILLLPGEEQLSPHVMISSSNIIIASRILLAA